MTHKSIFPVAQQTISLCRPDFAVENIFSFYLSVSTLNEVLATHLHVDLWVTKLIQSYWSQGSPVTAWGFHQPLTPMTLFPRAAPPFPRSDVIWRESMTRISPHSCSQTQQNRCAVSIPATMATLNDTSCSPCCTARKELSPGIRDPGLVSNKEGPTSEQRKVKPFRRKANIPLSFPSCIYWFQHMEL